MVTAVEISGEPLHPRDFLVEAIPQIDADGTMTLTVGDSICEISGNLANVVMKAIQAGLESDAVQVVALPELLTTGQAADILGVSRPTVVKLIQDGRLAASKIGSHRRVRTSDLMEYRLKQSTETAQAMDRLVELSGELGMYDR